MVESFVGLVGSWAEVPVVVPHVELLCREEGGTVAFPAYAFVGEDVEMGVAFQVIGACQTQNYDLGFHKNGSDAGGVVGLANMNWDPVDGNLVEAYADAYLAVVASADGDFGGGPVGASVGEDFAEASSPDIAYVGGDFAEEAPVVESVGEYFEEEALEGSFPDPAFDDAEGDHA